MQHVRRAGLLAVLGVMPIGCSATTGGSRPAAAPMSGAAMKAPLELQESFSRVADKVFPSLVCLTAFERLSAPLPEDPQERDNIWREATRAERRYPGMRRLASATGIAMTSDGDVLTCLEFLKKPGGGLADLVDAEAPDGSLSLCEVLGTEPTLNLAVLRLAVFPEGHPPVLVPVVIADPQTIRVGEWALAIGDPMGPQRTFAVGLVSARPQRDCYQADLAATFLEANLPVHPEAYGGPLVNIDGAVMGLIVPHLGDAIGATASGLAYALPMSIATGIYESLKVARSFASPWLGFSVLSMTEYRARMKARGTVRDPKEPLMGVYIDDVFDPSPASRAGVLVGDILMKVNGYRLPTVPSFQRSLYLAGIGNTITIELYRNGQTLTRDLTIEGRPASADSR